MKTLITLLSVALLAFSGSVLAHVKLKSSFPADNAMLTEAPKTVSLEFGKAVRVLKVSLKTKQGDAIKFGFKPSAEANQAFSWELPQLKPNNYKISVTFLGQDGHKMSDSFSFMIPS